jgi:fucose permease
VILVVVLLAFPALRGEPPHPAETGAPRMALLPRSLGIWLLGGMALFSMVPEGAVLDWAALYLGKELGAGPFAAGLAFAFFAGAMAVMRFAGDALRNRFGAVATLRGSGLLAAAGLLMAAVAPDVSVALAGFVLAGLGVANMVPIVFSAAGNYPGFAAGATLSTVTMVGYAGILVAPSSIGFLAEHAGFRPTYAALSLLLVVVSALAGRAAMADDRRSLVPAE